MSIDLYEPFAPTEFCFAPITTTKGLFQHDAVYALAKLQLIGTAWEKVVIWYMDQANNVNLFLAITLRFSILSYEKKRIVPS